MEIENLDWWEAIKAPIITEVDTQLWCIHMEQMLDRGWKIAAELVSLQKVVETRK